MSAIELRGVSKRFGATPVLEGLDLAVADRSVTALLGASGSGKTTTLRLIAGFEGADCGTISIGGRVVDDGRHVLRPQDRRIGYVPQDAGLFPHLTVRANVGFGVRRPDRSRIAELLALVGLTGLDGRYPHQLSGGQQQRVALARALATRPQVVLLDEPFGSLDASLRDTVRRDVIRILTETGTTTILVTHDQDEALSLADRVAVLRDGRLIADASPRGLYRSPPDLVAASAIGDANVLVAEVHAGVARCVLGDVEVVGSGEAGVAGAGTAAAGTAAAGSTAGAAAGSAGAGTAAAGSAALGDRAGGRAAGRAAVVGVGAPGGPGRIMLRPEQLDLCLSPQAGGVPATVLEVRYHGRDSLVRVTPVAAAGEPVTHLLVRATGDLAVHPGDRVWVRANQAARVWLDGSAPAPAVVPIP